MQKHFLVKRERDFCSYDCINSQSAKSDNQNTQNRTKGIRLGLRTARIAHSISQCKSGITHCKTPFVRANISEAFLLSHVRILAFRVHLAYEKHWKFVCTNELSSTT